VRISFKKGGGTAVRTILTALFLGVFALLSIPLYGIVIVSGLLGSRRRAKTAQGIIKTVSKIILFLSGVKITVIGTERVPAKEAALFIFNHRSYFDILICYCTVPAAAGFISMKSLAKIPFLNIWMLLLNCIFIDRKNIRNGLKAIRKGVDMIKRGYSLFVAPEGKRNFTGDIDMLPFKKGTFKLATKTGCPIIPVAINNADKIYEKHLPWIRSTHVVIEYGEPIYMADLNEEDRSSLHILTRDIIKKMLEKNQNSGLAR